jgi:hypothetical protein
MTNPIDEPLIQYLAKTRNKYSGYATPEICENCFEGEPSIILVANETAVPFVVCDKCNAEFKKLINAHKK